jgi:hypothetical protein
VAVGRVGGSPATQTTTRPLGARTGVYSARTAHYAGEMTPTGARYKVQDVLGQHAPFAEFWHVVAERERRCCWDPNCTKPPHELGGKIRVRVFPSAIPEATGERLAEVERILSSHLDGGVKTRIVPLETDASKLKPLRPGVYVWLD